MTSRLGTVGAFIAKDLRIHARDRFYVVVTVVGLVFFITVFWLLPAEVEETLYLGVHVDGDDPLVAMLGEEEGVELVHFASVDALQAAVEEGDELLAGLALPAALPVALAAGQRPTVRVILAAEAPEELRPAVTAMVREMAFALAGAPPPVTAPPEDQVVLGVDRAGQQLSLRDQLRPMFVFIALFVEMFALASLVAGEIQQRTITAVLTTPVRIGDVLLSKTVIGTALAFVQGMVLLVATGAATSRIGLLSLTLLLGAMLVTGIGLIAGSSGRDFVEVVFWSFLIGLPALIPAIGALFPGSAPTWVQVLPSYGLVQILTGTVAFGEGWSQAAPHLAAMAAWCAVLFVVGVLLLRRRVARL